MRRTAVILLAAAAPLALVACGDDRVEPATAGTDTTAALPTIAPAPFVALRQESRGGCEVLGPNCPTYVVWSDGRVEVLRTGHEELGVVLTGTVPVADVTAWLDAVRDLDPVALAARVGPGTCNSCVDGADLLVTAPTARGDVTLDSTAIAFDPAEPAFAALQRLTQDVHGIGQPPVVTLG